MSASSIAMPVSAGVALGAIVSAGRLGVGIAVGLADRVGGGEGEGVGVGARSGLGVPVGTAEAPGVRGSTGGGEVVHAAATRTINAAQAGRLGAPTHRTNPIVISGGIASVKGA